MVPLEEQSRTSQLRRRVFEIERLAATPQVVFELVRVLGDEGASAANLERVVESDQALSSKVLNIANSAYYGFANKVTTIQRAVVALGFQELRLLALGIGLADVFDQKKFPAGLDGQEMWAHCLAVSWMAKGLAEAASQPAPGEIMLAGLLHDMGKLVLAVYMTEEFDSILRLTGEGEPYFRAEKELGLKHATIGHWLAKKWGLPGLQAAAIRDHHSPRTNDPYYISTRLVSLADDLAKRSGFGLVHEAEPVDLAAVLEETRLTPDRVNTVVKEAKNQIPPLLETWQQVLTQERV